MGSLIVHVYVGGMIHYVYTSGFIIPQGLSEYMKIISRENIYLHIRVSKASWMSTTQ